MSSISDGDSNAVNSIRSSDSIIADEEPVYTHTQSRITLGVRVLCVNIEREDVEVVLSGNMSVESPN